MNGLKNEKAAICLKLFLILLIFVLISSIVILASVPPVSRDALGYHLALPKLYLQKGGIYEIPSIVFSYYPMNLDLLNLIPLYFGNDIVPKFIHFGFALLTAWLIFFYIRRRMNTIYALLGVIFFISIPIIVKLSITVYVDLGIIFFSTASLLSLLKWIETHFRMRYLFFSAMLCGLAIGTKYNGLIVLFLLTLFVPFLYSRAARDMKPGFLKSAGYGIFFLVVALLFFSPWMVRNYLWTNNPLFPLYDHWFNPQHGVDPTPVGLFSFRGLIYHENWWQMALLPVRIFFQGEDGNPQYFDGELNPFLFFLPFFAFYQIGRDPKILRSEKKIIIAFAGLFFLFAFFTSNLRIRYISPFIPPLVILSVFGVKKLREFAGNLSSPARRKIGGAVIFFIILFSLWLNANYILIQFGYVKPFDYLKGTLTREEYIERYRPEYAVMRYINDHLPSDVRILFIFMGYRGYYCDREYVFDMNYLNKSTLRQLVKSSDKPEDIFLGVRSMGITHLLMNHDIFNLWIKGKFAPRDQQLLAAFFRRYVKRLFSKSGYGVFHLQNIN